jgi:hypothetical protein
VDLGELGGEELGDFEEERTAVGLGDDAGDVEAVVADRYLAVVPGARAKSEAKAPASCHATLTAEAAEGRGSSAACSLGARMSTSAEANRPPEAASHIAGEAKLELRAPRFALAAGSLAQLARRSARNAKSGRRRTGMSRRDSGGFRECRLRWGRVNAGLAGVCAVRNSPCLL